MKIFCVIPNYNKAEYVEKVVNEVAVVVDQVIVVDDGSSDNSLEVLDRTTATVLSHLINRGQGTALKTGTDYALDQGAEVIIHFDADGQFRAQDIVRVIEPILNNQADVVFGSRFLDTTTQLPAFKKYIIMPIARWINAVFFKIKLTDPQSGFRAFSRQAALLVDWQQDRMAHCNEILINAHQQPLRIREVPITVIYHEFGQKFSGGIMILRDLFLASLNK
jgi:glycosyltransferase involved in cell wall biosynthesis